MHTDTLYSIRELLQDHVVDLDIERQKPLPFKIGDDYLICAPVKSMDHPEFIFDLVRILTRHQEVFVKVSFLSSENYLDKNAVQTAIQNITIFNDSIQYKRFMKKDVPSFIMKWGKTVRKKDLKKFHKTQSQDKDFRAGFVKIPRKMARRILSNITADEMLYVLMSLWVFNHDIVKKKCLSFMQSLQGGIDHTQMSSGSAESSKKKEPMPKFSMKPYSKESLEIFAKQSKMN